MGRSDGDAVGRLLGLPVGAKGSTTQRTPAPNSHLCPEQQAAGRLGLLAPQAWALSPSEAHTVPSDVVNIGSTNDSSVQNNFRGPGWQTKPLQQPSGRSAAGAAPQEVALTPSVPHLGASGMFALAVHVTL